jgi:alkylation response protein AidB-like acyl-CoA dehydrogenase
MSIGDAPAWETADLRAFRAEVRSGTARLLPSDIRAKVELGLHLEKDDYERWERIMAAQGWLVGHWPVEYGGQGWSPLHRYIFLEETSRAGAPKTTPFGVNYVGPVIYTYGTEEQKERFLPAIRNVDTFWCQGYSEPGAGSDLAGGLATRAERTGDVYRVTGQKTWTTAAHWADMMFALVRTSREDKPQKGISFLLIDMTAPGVTVRPIITMDGCHDLNDVFLDEVPVPVANRVGEEGKGWGYGKFLLSNERMATIGAIGRAKGMLARLNELALRVREGGQPVAETQAFRRKLAELEISLAVIEAMCVKLLKVSVAGAQPGVEASIIKLRSTQLTQAIAQGFADIQMRRGLPYDARLLASHEIEDPDSIGLLRMHLIGRASTIFGGAAEVQRNIIAQTALAL